MVREKALEFMDEVEAAGHDLAVIEIPLFFETGVKYSIDKVVTIHCDPQIQRQRVLARPGMSSEKLDFILSRQLSQDEKRARADYAIDTSGTMDDTIARSDAVIDALLEEVRA